MEGRCVILTTHSMEECEALCHRLGIMVNGQLRCLGTPQHLKSRFGKGYQLDITFADRELQQQKAQLRIDAEAALKEHFTVNLIEANQNKATFELSFEKKESMTLAQVFRVMENLKEKLSIITYALNQTTLEQIFVRIAQLIIKEKDKIFVYDSFVGLVFLGVNNWFSFFVSFCLVASLISNCMLIIN
ncbi:ABC Transporter family member (abt-4)-like protein [Reticulomyxa filosa]|uniref:ABC Transporter family member (Abt-4)-like protein n=1 Tax=Reticulomyxa filosa TaxID=46433 RepID=X6MBK8_RETFI|nr:ABC Transporter family member (abt-4)-like protein [Reticulomyxa filosa]|eukprot:ETO10842.1 ABC Transporter family member (abt-4)-like protein [Reticulomyxa filosa]